MEGESTKKNIVKALHLLMKTTPLDKISVTDVSRKANISRQTFYYHFNSMYDVFDWYMKTNVPIPRSSFPNGPAPSPSEYIINLCTFFESKKRYILEFRRVYRDEFYDHIENCISVIFLDYLQHILPDTARKKDVDVLAEFLTTAFAAVIHKWFNSDMTLDIKSQFSGLFNALYSGIPVDALGRVIANAPRSVWQPESDSGN